MSPGQRSGIRRIWRELQAEAAQAKPSKNDRLRSMRKRRTRQAAACVAPESQRRAVVAAVEAAGRPAVAELLGVSKRVVEHLELGEMPPDAIATPYLYELGELAGWFSNY